jgi:transcription factor VIP1
VGGGHRRSGSMDGSISNLPAGLFEAESAGPSVGSDYAKAAIAPDRLAELALIDPKRAKRCIASNFFLFV